MSDEGGGKRWAGEDERTEDKRADGAEWIDALAGGCTHPPPPQPRHPFPNTPLSPRLIG